MPAVQDLDVSVGSHFFPSPSVPQDKDCVIPVLLVAMVTVWTVLWYFLIETCTNSWSSFLHVDLVQFCQGVCLKAALCYRKWNYFLPATSSSSTQEKLSPELERSTMCLVLLLIYTMDYACVLLYSWLKHVQGVEEFSSAQSSFGHFHHSFHDFGNELQAV